MNWIQTPTGIWIKILLVTCIFALSFGLFACGNGDCDNEGVDDGNDDIADPDAADPDQIDPIDEIPPESTPPTSEPVAYPLLPPPETINPFEFRNSYTLNAHTCATAIGEFELSNEGTILFAANDLVMHVTDPGDSGIPAKTEYRTERKIGLGGYPFLHIIIPKCYAGTLLFPRQAAEASALSGLGFSPGDFYMVCRDGSEDDGVCYLSYEKITEEIPLSQSPETGR